MHLVDGMEELSDAAVAADRDAGPVDAGRVPDACTSTDDCGALERCQGGYCVDNHCVDDGDCTWGRCVARVCACSTKYDCLSTEVCNRHSRCVPPPSGACTSDAACVAGQVCSLSQACVAGCADDRDCAPGKSCDALAFACQ